jgi:putative ABC transport system ATP-binding protein
VNHERVVELRKIVKEYENGRVKALRGVDLNVSTRSFVALAGPSGSGKTTLLNMIGALDVPDSGTVRVAGKRFDQLDERARTNLRRTTIGFVFQQFNLVPVLTAVENVELPLEIISGTTRTSRRDSAMDILAKVGLKGMEERFPSQLSGGQQQRVAVARALVKKPALILADEPTANLDGEAGLSILEMMKEMREELDTTFIFASHDTRLLKRVDNVIEMVDGCIRS